MEAVNAYYDGHSFIPTKPVNVRKNQKAIITILDEAHTENSVEVMKKTIRELRGAFKGIGLSSDEFAAGKQLEKELEL
jgi:phage terminase large subunit-like protein